MEASASAEDRLRELGDQLADGVEAALPAWVERCVARIHEAWAGRVPAVVSSAAAEAGRRAAADVGGEVRRLVAADVDEQWTNPLSLVRRAVRYPTAVLRAAGVPPVERDRFDERHFPEDDYALVPLSFGDVDASLQETGLMWGAAKARAHLLRHRRGAG